MCIPGRWSCRRRSQGPSTCADASVREKGERWNATNHVVDNARRITYSTRLEAHASHAVDHIGRGDITPGRDNSVKVDTAYRLCRLRHGLRREQHSFGSNSGGVGGGHGVGGMLWLAERRELQQDKQERKRRSAETWRKSASLKRKRVRSLKGRGEIKSNQVEELGQCCSGEVG